MPSPTPRRRFLGACSGAFAVLGGCLSADTGTGPNTETPTTRSRTPSETTTDEAGSPPVTTSGETGSPSASPTQTPTTGPAGGPSIASLSVRDFFQYALSGTHPHVYRRANTQYVFVRVESAADAETVRRKLALTLDGEQAETAAREPVSWLNETVDVAIAVPKGETHDRGELSYGGDTLRPLSADRIERLNNPPVFEVSDLSVSPEELDEGEETTATVRFTLANTGPGRGTFGASLKGNYVSGSHLVTATLDAGSSREVTADTRVVGTPPRARVNLDWGSDDWTTGIPVVESGTATGTASQT